jgi:hypothetical protein
MIQLTQDTSAVSGCCENGNGSAFESQSYQEFSFLHVVQTGFGVHPASYLMDTGGSFPRGNAARA